MYGPLVERLAREYGVATAFLCKDGAEALSFYPSSCFSHLTLPGSSRCCHLLPPARRLTLDWQHLKANDGVRRQRSVRPSRKR